MKGNQYKTNGDEQKEIASKIREEIAKDIQSNIDKFKDPVVLGELVFSLLKEREATNHILKNLLQRIEKLEMEIKKSRQETIEKKERLLPKQDMAIMEYLKEKGNVTAEDVRKAMGYKGKNAASARLNKLYQMKLINKKQVGREVYFFIK